jgi:oligoribonuclease
MVNKENNLVWIDLEMTGLNPEYDVILEIASIITTANLEILTEGPNIVIHQPDEVLASMNTWCKENHAKSGLIKAVQKSTSTLKQAEEQTLDVIKTYCKQGTAILTGNSVWNDRNFLAKYMPQIINYLHYKLIDTTSIQQVIQHWYPHNPQNDYKKAETHRAAPDIRESIEELKHYRKYFFIS